MNEFLVKWLSESRYWRA